MEGRQVVAHQVVVGHDLPADATADVCGVEEVEVDAAWVLRNVAVVGRCERAVLVNVVVFI